MKTFKTKLLLCVLVLFSLTSCTNTKEPEATVNSSNQFSSIYPPGRSLLDFSSLADLGPVNQWLTTNGSDFTWQGNSAPIRLVGTNLTDTACFATSEAEIKPYLLGLKRLGFNTIRLHHIDWYLWENPTMRSQLAITIRTAASLNMRVTLDLYSKARDNVEGIDAMKKGIVEGDPTIRARWEAYVDHLLGPSSPLYQDKTIVIINVMNEISHYYSNEQLDITVKFYDYAKKLLRDKGYGGIVTMNGAGISKSSDKTLNAYQECSNIHFYGDHPRVWVNQYPTGNFPGQGWQWGTAIDLGTNNGNPTIIEEWGCLPFNPNRMTDEVFLACEFSRLKVAGAFSFCWADGKSKLAGNFNTTDWFAVCTDEPRVVTNILTNLILHCDKWITQPKVYWAHLQGFQDPHYTYESDFVMADINRSNGYVFVSTKGTRTRCKEGYYFDMSQFVNQGFESMDVDGFWREVKNFGTFPQTALKVRSKIKLPIGTKIVHAYAVDSRTGEKIGRLSVDANGYIQPITPITAVIAW
jgi:hypothetical protein